MEDKYESYIQDGNSNTEAIGLVIGEFGSIDDIKEELGITEAALDYCPKINKKIKQNDVMFKMNTDSVMLGQFIKIKKHDTVLDVGTNNGVLLLYASTFNPQKLIGIDIFEEAILVAKENMIMNAISNVTLEVKNFKDYRGMVDVIICNPPYFVGENQNESEFLRLARHEVSLPMEMLFKISSLNLSAKGRLFVIYPASRLESMILLGHQFGFSLKRMKLNYKESKQKAHTVCAEFVKGGKEHLEIEMFELIA